MRLGKFTVILLAFVISLACAPGFSSASSQSASQQTFSTPAQTVEAGISSVDGKQSAAKPILPPLPVVPFIMNYDYETKYFMQWIANCPQYSMITASVSKSDPALIQITLTEAGTGERVYYSNSEEKIKLLTQAGLNAHLVKIDFKTGEDADERRIFAFGFSDEHNVPIRWGFVAYGQSSDRGAGPRIQAVNAGLLVSYNELGATSAPTSVVQIGDQKYEVEEWPEISKPPYFIGYRGTFSEGLTMGLLLKGSENWHLQSAPTSLSKGAKWVLVDDRKFVRQLQVTAKHADELTITELTDSSPWARAIEMVVKTDGQNFALKSLARRAGPNSMRINFTPELNLNESQPDAPPVEHTFQIDENAHLKVLQGAATVEVRDGALILKLRPKAEGSRQAVIPKDYVITSTIKTLSDSYKLEVN